MAKSYQIKSEMVRADDSDLPRYARALKVMETEAGETVFVVAKTEYEVFEDFTEAKEAFEANK